MECAFVGVVEEANKVCLRSLLEGKEGRALHSQIQLYVTSKFVDKTLEGCLPHQKVHVRLVFTDLTKGNGPRAPTTGFPRHQCIWLGCVQPLLQDECVGPFPQLTCVRSALFLPLSNCCFCFFVFSCVCFLVFLCVCFAIRCSPHGEKGRKHYDTKFQH